VTFSGGAFGEARTYDVQVASRNVSRDAVLILGQGQNVSTEGDDILVGTEDDDVINGLGGNDVISAGAGNDIINGGAGDDEIYGEDDNDVLLGGDGDDRFFSEEGFDEIDGGAGLDWMMFEQNVDDVILFRGDDSLAFLVFTEDGSHYDQVKNVEFFAFADQNLSEAQVESIAAGQSTSDAQKTLTTGTSGAETLQGTDEADLIVSGGGALDYLTGLAGADTFVFGDEVGNGMVERDIITDFTEGVDDIDLGGAEVAQVVQTSQGIVVRLEGDGDVIYLDNFGLDLAAATDIFGLT